MTQSQELQLRSSEVRERLNVLQSAEKRNDEDRAEMNKLTTELTDVETRFRSALATEQTTEEPGDADVQIRTLAGRANAGEVFEAAIEHRATAGATRELQDEFKLNGNQIPLCMLRYGVEERALTPAPANVGTNQNEIIPGVFPMSCHAFLGIDTPTVAVGEAVYPVLKTNATVHKPAEGAVAGETTGSFSAEVLSPSRLQAAFEYSREDRARFMGMDAALRMNLSDALSDGLDSVIISGDDEGLLHGTNLDNHAAAAVTTYANYRAQYAYGRVDGKWAMDVMDLRLVMGSGTYAHAAGVFRSTNAGDRAALEDLMDATSGVKVSSHVPVVASHKQNAIIRLGMRRDAVAPVWEGVTIIPDEVTKAENGTIIITAVMLYAFKILRAGGFYKQESQHA